MPMTIQLGTTALMQPNERSEIRVYSERFNEMAIIRPHQVDKGPGGTGATSSKGFCSLPLIVVLGVGSICM